MNGDDERFAGDERPPRDITEFANPGGQPVQPMRPPAGHSLVRPTTGLAEHVIGARIVEVKRDEAEIFNKLAVIAARAGDDWFYRFPVSKKGGGQDYIEGPSIKLANDVARIYGNNITEIREVDVGDAWVFYARFTDVETGFSMERAFRQYKGQPGMRTTQERQQQQAYANGQSKAIRNVIVNSLQMFTDFAFKEARGSLVNKIGKDLDGWRERTLQGLAKIPVDLPRVERVIGRAQRAWLAPDVAQIIAMMQTIADGMNTVDEVFPPIEEKKEEAKPEAKPAEQPTTTVEATADAKGATADSTAAQRSDAEGPTGEGAAQATAPKREPAPSSTITELEVAYQRGQKAKSDHVSPKVIPPDYRDSSKTREQLAYRAGFDGSPMPNFEDKK